MSKGMFTAVSGAIAQSARLDTIANNLANVNTPGFKRDGQLFREYLTSYEKEPGTITVPRIPASIESFYDMQGGDKSFVDPIGTYSDFSQGALKPTGNPLDIALEGSGFIEVLTPQGSRLARSGSLSVNQDGLLVTKQGFPVLREGLGQPPESREIRLQGGSIAISSHGEIFENGNSVAKISLLDLKEKDGLVKEGRGLLAVRDDFTGTLVPAQEMKIHQGFLEGSNVNLVREMTDMITASRTFESTQKVIQAYDQMAGKLVNDVPKLG